VLLAIKKLWRTDIPSKVNVFGWWLLLGRLPTRLALYRRGVLVNPQDLLCVFCSLVGEDIPHLFFSCNFTKNIWNEVSTWIGKNCPLGEQVITTF
jgi:hypothetical protein